MIENNILKTEFVKKQYTVEDIKVNDRCHITGKYAGPCITNVSTP